MAIRTTHALTADGPQVVVVRAQDDPHDMNQPRGKQDWQERPHAIWYERTTGIWQPVWLEPVPRTHVDALRFVPDLDRAFGEFHRVLRPGGWIVFAGEPSRFGDRLAAVPKSAAVAVAPAWRWAMRAAPAPPSPPSPNASMNGDEAGLEKVVDIHAFSPDDLARFAHAAGFADVRVRGEELLANWFGWFNRGLESTADPAGVPMLWRQYAFRGYLLLQRVDERLLEPRLPPAIFYNLLLAARRS